MEFSNSHVDLKIASFLGWAKLRVTFCYKVKIFDVRTWPTLRFPPKLELLDGIKPNNALIESIHARSHAGYPSGHHSTL